MSLSYPWNVSAPNFTLETFGIGLPVFTSRVKPSNVYLPPTEEYLTKGNHLTRHYVAANVRTPLSTG
jgi:hypothetical protein